METSPASLDALVNAALLHFLQSHTDLRFRHGVAAGLASAVNALIPRQTPDAQALGHGRRLAGEGWTGLGQVLTADQVAIVVEQFVKRPCFNGPVSAMSDRIGRRVGEGAERFPDGSYPLADVVAVPFLLEVANRPDVLAVAEAYLGCTPTLYALNAAWSFAGTGAPAAPAYLGRDDDDYKFCALFVYLTDIGPQSGAPVFIRRSHRADLVEAIARERSVPLDQLYQMAPSAAHDRLFGEVFRGVADTITGPPGFAFLADTSGLHKLPPPGAGRRLIFTARYGLYRNTRAAVTGEGAVPLSMIGMRLPRDARTIYVNRCLIRDMPAAEPGGASP